MDIGLASIGAFLEHFESMPVPQAVPRTSLRLQLPRRRETVDPANVLPWLLVAILHVGMFLALELEIRASAIANDAVDQPLQTTFINMAATPVVITQPAAHTTTNHGLHPQAITPRSDNALKVVEIPQPVAAPPIPAPTRIELQSAPERYGLLSAGPMPVPTATRPADPFARRPAADMLPGSDRVRAPGIHVRAELSAQHVVEVVGAMLFGGGPVDPCPEYEQRLLNADSPSERDEQMDRYVRACPGR